MRSLAVVIVSYNSAAWLPPCLSSVWAHAGDVELDVVVVDNESTDGSPELVERLFPQVRVLRRPNRGFAAGNNAGLAVVDAPHVLFLNPDTEVLEGSFEELLAALDTLPEVAMIGCRQVDAEGLLQPTIRRFPSAARYLFEALGSERLGLRADWAGERVTRVSAYARDSVCDWVSGSFLLGRTDLVRAAGGFDDRYFLYSEEPDLCLRLLRGGGLTRYLPLMTIRHYAGKAGISVPLIAQDAYSRKQYMAKNMPPLQRHLATLAFAFGLAIRAYAPKRDREGSRLRRKAARRAIATLYGFAPPPFG